jgi:hypothetical protein
VEPNPYKHTESDHTHREPQLPEPPHSPLVPPESERPQNHAQDDTPDNRPTQPALGTPASA